ncbi:MAG TPA: hypothetical protein VGP64_06580 [Polyangia bacterium]|jgi:hypothetical protein
MWASASILAVLLTAELPPPAPEPPPEDPPAVGVAMGTATALVPLVVGGALMVNDRSPRLQEAGMIVTVSGLALAPWVAHGLEGSWTRAAIYGGATTLLSTATVVAMEASDAFNQHTGNRARIPMKILLGASLGSSFLGVVMSAFDRHGLRPVSRLSLWLAPGGLGGGLGWSRPL